MITTKHYSLEYDTAKQAYRVHSTEAPYCSLCGFLMSGYDTRRRKAIDGAGAVYWLLLRRLYCPRCRTYHIELPAYMQPYKQYEAAVINDREHASCPAESSTIKGWKK